jgi:hypothetical protein
MKLLQSRNFGIVQGTFPSTPGFMQFTRNTEIYAALVQLARMNVINCPGEDTCNPAQNGKELRGGNGGPFVYNAGTFSLAEIVGIREVTASNALVQARLKFNGTPFFEQYRGLLVRLQTGQALNGLQVQQPLAEQTLDQIEEIEFQLFDDGWRPAPTQGKRTPQRPIASKVTF